MTRESDFDTIVPILLYQNIFSLLSNHFFEQMRLPKDFQFFKNDQNLSTFGSPEIFQENTYKSNFRVEISFKRFNLNQNRIFPYSIFVCTYMLPF